MGKKKHNKKKSAFKIGVPDIQSDYQTPSLNTLDARIPYRDRNPIFSFSYYDEKHRHYSARSVATCNDFCLLFKHLRMYSTMTWGQIEAGKHHAHEVEWSKSKQPTGFSGSLAIPKTYPPYQFVAYGKARIVGFHKNKVFYIVWFDVNHQIFPS